MKKCYIAGPVTGTEDFKERFAAAEQEVTRLGMKPVNPVTLPHLHDKKWESYMRECIITLMDCTAVYVLKNYAESQGTVVELRLATTFNYEIIYQ